MPDNTPIKNEIKSHLAEAGITLTAAIDKINDGKEVKTNIQNIVNKISRETIKYKEVKEIADAAGYDIVWVKRE